MICFCFAFAFPARLPVPAWKPKRNGAAFGHRFCHSSHSYQIGLGGAGRGRCRCRRRCVRRRFARARRLAELSCKQVDPVVGRLGRGRRSDGGPLAHLVPVVAVAEPQGGCTGRRLIVGIVRGREGRQGDAHLRLAAVLAAVLAVVVVVEVEIVVVVARAGATIVVPAAGAAAQAEPAAQQYRADRAEQVGRDHLYLLVQNL